MFENDENLIIADSLNNIGLNNSYLNKNENALEYFERAFSIYKILFQNENNLRIAGNLNNISETYNNLKSMKKHLVFPRELYQNIVICLKTILT